MEEGPAWHGAGLDEHAVFDVDETIRDQCSCGGAARGSLNRRLDRRLILPPSKHGLLTHPLLRQPWKQQLPDKEVPTAGHFSTGFALAPLVLPRSRLLIVPSPLAASREDYTLRRSAFGTPPLTPLRGTGGGETPSCGTQEVSGYAGNARVPVVP